MNNIHISQVDPSKNNISIQIKDSDLKSKKMDIFIGYYFDNKDIKRLFEVKIRELIEKDLLRNYRPVMDSRLELNSTIMENIISQIDKSRIAIIDLTEHRHNVYFEAGILFGKNIPVIFTAHEKEKNKIPFDVNSYKIFYWNETEEKEKSFLTNIRECILLELN
jgi:nucleoside 2-deoxyribosyltransferase